MGLTKWKLLQLFADGAAATGETPADAGQDMGAAGNPEAMLETRAQEGQAAAATEGRMTWEQIKADPEYSAEIQKLIRSRLKNAKQAQADLEVLEPVLRTLAEGCGLAGETLDYGALAQALQTKHRAEAEVAQQQTQTVQQHFRLLTQQARQLQRKYPGFDLKQELKDPTFARLTAPGTGISLEDAYYTVHRRQIEQAAMQTASSRTAHRISNAIRSGNLRPAENGIAGTAPSVTAFDYRNASPEQRQALKARIRKAGARGEKIYPGEL